MIMIGEIKNSERKVSQCQLAHHKSHMDRLGSTRDKAVLFKLFTFLFPATHLAQNNQRNDETNPDLVPNTYGSHRS